MNGVDHSHEAQVYHGQDLHTIDAKGRVNIPARHRRIASKKGSLEFWFTPGFDGCIFLWDAEGFTAYCDRIASLPNNADEARRYRRLFFSRAARVEPDNQGRVVIPEHLRKDVGLTTHVLIMGVQDRLELWQPETYTAYEGSTSESVTDIASRLVL
jgi:MraZ protein